MKIFINGTPREIEAPVTLDSLLTMLDVPKEGIAIALNREIVPKAKRQTRTLRENDDVDIIHAVCGG